MDLLNKKNHLLAPREFWRLAIRITNLFNKALLSKHMWKIVLLEDSILGQWVSNKYGRRSQLGVFKMSSQPPWCWKNINNNKDLIFNHLKWRIGNGQRVSLQDNFWWKSMTQVDGVDKVANLIDHSNLKWRNPLVIRMFALNIDNTIQNSQIARYEIDVLIWDATTIGNFLAAKGYDFLLKDELPNSLLSIPQSFPWNDFWKMNAPARLLMFIWRLRCNALPCGDMLHR